MTGIGRVAGTALALALAATAPAGDRKPDFDARKDEALRNLETDAGRKYVESFGKEFGAQYAPTLNACTQKTGAPMGDDFELLMKLGAKGEVVEAWVRPETKLAECFRKRAQARTYPTPPSAGYLVVNGIKFTKQPAP
jgi:hypothetical protein